MCDPACDFAPRFHSLHLLNLSNIFQKQHYAQDGAIVIVQRGASRHDVS
jgi:hypothetical protein